MKKPLVLADDLSGAMEAAAAFLRHGWRPAIPLGEFEMDTDSLPVISTETRNLAPVGARQALARLSVSIRAKGGDLLFKKIDSTMRGPAGAELSAMLEVWPDRPVFVAPANPGAGRTVCDGVLLVVGMPVTQTAFHRDPGFPVRHDELNRLLAASGYDGAVAQLPLAVLRLPGGECADALRKKIAAGDRVFVCDAQYDSDLQALVRAAREAHGAPLFAGASALGAVIAAQTQPPMQSAESVPKRRLGRGSALFVCGSKHPASHRQMEQLGVPIRVLPRERESWQAFAARIADDLKARNCAAVMTLDFPGSSGDALAALGAAIQAVARAAPFDVLFATGGETARAVCRQLGGSSLSLVAEIETGVIAAEMMSADGVRLVITKPGGYGDDASLARVRAWLEKWQRQ